MKKKYLVEFTHLNGKKEEVEFETDRIDWTIEQWVRNRAVSNHRIISENSINTKSMLFG